LAQKCTADIVLEHCEKYARRFRALGEEKD
jgi:hypothetical protein